MRLIRGGFAGFLLLPSLAGAVPPASGVPAGRPADDAQLMTRAEYRQGLELLRGYLQKRGEEGAAADIFVDDLARAFAARDGEALPVTRGVFAAFLRYESAWARKTRDAKNELVPRAQLLHEAQRAEELKAEFKERSRTGAPGFYRAFQAAVRDVRGAGGSAGRPYAGDSGVFFGDQVDDSYSHVDAGDEALEQGDAAAATAEAAQALAENPANADALVLRAGAEYAQGNAAAAILDAQSALKLDPGNQQAQAIVSLSSTPPPPGLGALSSAADAAAALSDGSRLAPAGAASPIALVAAAGARAPLDAPRAPPSPTPALGARLSMDLTQRAASAASAGGADARASIGQFDRALALNPRNTAALDWRASLANRDRDYGDAMDWTNRALAVDPGDANAYFNRARAQAGSKDRQGFMDSLKAAARLDGRYQKVLDLAARLPTDAELDAMFNDFAAPLASAAASPAARSWGAPVKALGGLGALLILLGIGQAFVPRRG